jgi:CRISPR-associated endoribonuclease Cas6
MPLSLVIQGQPQADVAAIHIQGSSLHGMFMELIHQLDEQLFERLHVENRYRPFTLSPIAPSTDVQRSHESWLPRDQTFAKDMLLSFRITLLDNTVFAVFSKGVLDLPDRTIELGGVRFTIKKVVVIPNGRWARFCEYPDLIRKASAKQRRITLRFLTPVSFRRGNVDFLLPDPRLVFGSYRRRFEEFHDFDFLPDFDELVSKYVGVTDLRHFKIQHIRTRKINFRGFIGSVTYSIDPKTPPEVSHRLTHQINLLADYAYYCGTGRKTPMGMGQTIRERDKPPQQRRKG